MSVFLKQNIPKLVPSSPYKTFQNQISTCKWSLNIGFSRASLNHNSRLSTSFHFQAYDTTTRDALRVAGQILQQSVGRFNGSRTWKGGRRAAGRSRGKTESQSASERVQNLKDEEAESAGTFGEFSTGAANAEPQWVHQISHTQYYSTCTVTVPPGRNFVTKRWIRNCSELFRLSLSWREVKLQLRCNCAQLNLALQCTVKPR
jgi:hypothetical protein